MNLPDEDDLDLPDPIQAPGEPPRLTFAELIRQCESMLPHWNRIRNSCPEPHREMDPFYLD